jgi:hypothetical protein
MRRLPLLAILLLLGACTTAPVPEGYKGPVARINDTSTPRSGTSVDFFYIAEVNGRRIQNSAISTRQANYGRGFAMTPSVIGRDIPAEPSTVKIVGRTEHAAPILALMKKVYEVSGETQFTPEANQVYTVKGVLKDDYSAVWIENAAGAVMGQKIEIKGSSTLDFFNK